MKKRKKALTFSRLRKTNVTRCEKYIKHRLTEWTAAEWSNAMAGECGEACNLTKKLRRGDKIDIKDIGKELADVVCYADLLAAKLGIDLGDAIVEKFNEVSHRWNVPMYL